MDAGKIAEVMEQRFNRSRSRTVIARVRPAKDPIVFSHVIRNQPTLEKTLAPPVEAAYSIHVHHKSQLLTGEVWIDGKFSKLPPIRRGGICIFDLQTSPVALVREAFEFTRISITQAALDDLAYERGLPRASGFRIPRLGHPDPVIHGLAQALIGRVGMFGEETDSLFADWVALAFHAHVVDVYTEARQARTERCRMAPWRLRAACEFMMDRLEGPLSIADIAAHVDMTAGYFARAFRQATGEPPHRWLMRRRVDRAKGLLRMHKASLADVAAACGFVDQSHFTRVFGSIEGKSPGQWRLCVVD